MTALQWAFLAGAVVALVSVLVLLALIHLAATLDNERPAE